MSLVKACLCGESFGLAVLIGGLLLAGSCLSHRAESGFASCLAHGDDFEIELDNLLTGPQSFSKQFSRRM